MQWDLGAKAVEMQIAAPFYNLKYSIGSYSAWAAPVSRNNVTNYNQSEWGEK